MNRDKAPVAPLWIVSFKLINVSLMYPFYQALSSFKDISLSFNNVISALSARCSDEKILVSLYSIYIKVSYLYQDEL